MNIKGLDFKHLIDRKKIKQNSLAEKLGVSHSAIGNWIKNNRIPDGRLEELKSIIGVEFETCFIDESLAIVTDPQLDKNDNLIPYYSVDVLAGNSGTFDQILASSPTDYYQLPSSSSDMVVDVYGDSMVDRIYSGDKIAISRLNDTSFFNYGAVHVIVTKEQRLLKYLKKHENPSKLKLVSQNEFYDTIEIPKKSILEIWIVDEILRKARN